MRNKKEEKAKDVPVVEAKKDETPEEKAKREVREKFEAERKWLEDLNNEAEEKAKELSAILEAEVEPVVYVIEPGKDAAVAFVKKPDVAQSLKILRVIGEDLDSGLLLATRTQLVRECNGKVASDPRFMDAEGNYDKKYTELNLSIVLRMKGVVGAYADSFKKK